ncbi:hypothetical protein A2482_03910 [Candidatus Falkowbacteria bacterium RIFOXYC2_FULL_48_21]|uniref:Uncharacterized protein n=1 Tax=Candidatus Falkowbacteria bacterium RIFOXYC2_FULL_48_21 TaxID=1798005 RepID=A0A1F5TCL0_9BACT|nr:MAG: hypothetical protein A2482_03910 [Candidatus Falkowbacteria bacterium RIFOXYC2_FULL_48_21]
MKKVLVIWAIYFVCFGLFAYEAHENATNRDARADVVFSREYGRSSPGDGMSAIERRGELRRAFVTGSCPGFQHQKYSDEFRTISRTEYNDAFQLGVAFLDKERTPPLPRVF